MLGSTPLTQILGAHGDNSNHEAMRAYIKALCGAGMSVVLIMPGTKEPFDGRTVRKRNAADKVAKTEAQAAGRRDWQKAKSPSGLALATSDAKVILNKGGYLDTYIAAFGDDCEINLAVEVGASRLIVIDADTTEQREKFLEVSGAPEDMPPTVITPGTEREGTAIHYDGGHFYFTVTEEDSALLPTNMGSMTWGGDDGFAVLWDRRYVLLPPSTRAEGSYELVGRDYECPEWILTAIHERANAKASRFHDNNTAPTDDLGMAIDAWAETVSWASILEPLGWTPTVRADNCGCDVWTAPGNHSSPKSATTHDAGCGLGRYTETNAPMKIWTDNPGEPFSTYVEETGSTTMSKLQAVSYSDYEGNIGKAMDALELGDVDEATTLDRDLGVDQRNLSQDIVLPEPHGFVDLTLEQAAAEPKIAPHVDCRECHQLIPADDPSLQTDADGDVWHETEDSIHMVDDGTDIEDAGEVEGTPFDLDDDAPVNPDIFECGIVGVPIIAPFSHWRDMPPPEYIIDGLIEHGGLSSIIGPPGVGKSSVVLDMLLSIAAGRPWQGRKVLQTKVLYMPGEGLSGGVQRIKAWCYEHNIPEEVIDGNFRLANDIIKVSASPDAWAAICEYILRQRIGLVVFDTYARMSVGVDENSATEVGRAIARLDQVRKITNAGAVVVHHTGKGDQRSGRGSSALQGALDSELLVAPASWSFTDPVLDSNGEEGSPLYTEEDVENKLVPSGKRIELDVTKQKNAEQLNQPIKLMMRNCETYSAPYITGFNGEIDPMIGSIVLARPRPEPVLQTAIRIREYLDQFDELSMAKSEIARGVPPDPFTASRADASRAWAQQILLALDLGLHYRLLDHPWGAGENPSKLVSKFISGDESVETARTLHARSILQDGEGLLTSDD
jgi:hypothetical protein